jgi:hypothetical protein
LEPFLRIDSPVAIGYFAWLLGKTITATGAACEKTNPPEVKKSAAMIHAPAAAEKNTKNAA